MSNLKRLRTTAGGPEVGLPPDKRVLYQFGNNDYDYGRETHSRIWPESFENSYISQNTVSEIVPPADPVSNHVSPNRRDYYQGQQSFNNELCQAGENAFYLGGEVNELNISIPAAGSQNAFGGAVFANPNNDLPMESLVRTPEDALKTSKVCFGTVCDHSPTSTNKFHAESQSSVM
jgi:hypothetical protein